ncbi:hypothetical protein KI387_020020, partial [Taxus chinensis]
RDGRRDSSSDWGSVCGMERTRLWNGVEVTDTIGCCVAMGICETMGADGVMAWVVDEGTTDMTGASDTADAMVMAGMGPSCETTGGEAGEGNTALLGADADAGIRAREMDTGMS